MDSSRRIESSVVRYTEQWPVGSDGILREKEETKQEREIDDIGHNNITNGIVLFFVFVCI